MSRTEQSRVAQRGRAFALILAAAFAGACGDDSGDEDKQEDSGAADASRPDASRDAGGMDARVDAGSDAGGDAARDGSTVDAGPLAVAGEDAPTLTKIGFYTGESPDPFGRRILIYGSDKNGDIASYTISFFSDAAGTMPVSVDTDGDSTSPGAPTATNPIDHNAVYQDFFAKLTPSAEVTDVVKAIKIKVTDKGGRSSEEKLAKLEKAPQVGGTCDPNGFNVCSNNGICTPAANGNYTCQTVNNARQAACTNNAVLALNAPGNVAGTLNTASFWDWPTGCVGGDTMIGFADRVIKVTLAAPAAKLTLSTGADATFDSVIYQLPTATPACSANPQPCGDNGCSTCADGDLVLTNVPAGDWYFVVDRAPSEKTGTTFTLTATVE